ncbi:FAD-dependent oxidoreductase [Nostoc favosum]|nr:FAD-dependent oxidoreductase [Nostoc favosum]
MNFDYDLFVIGAGPGGVAAARQSAAHGARVLMTLLANSKAPV